MLVGVGEEQCRSLRSQTGRQNGGGKKLSIETKAELSCFMLSNLIIQRERFQSWTVIGCGHSRKLKCEHKYGV